MILTLCIVVSNMQVTRRDEVQGLFSMKDEIEYPQEDDICWQSVNKVERDLWASGSRSSLSCSWISTQWLRHIEIYVMRFLWCLDLILDLGLQKAVVVVTNEVYNDPNTTYSCCSRRTEGQYRGTALETI